MTSPGLGATGLGDTGLAATGLGAIGRETSQCGDLFLVSTCVDDKSWGCEKCNLIHPHMNTQKGSRN